MNNRIKKFIEEKSTSNDACTNKNCQKASAILKNPHLIVLLDKVNKQQDGFDGGLSQTFLGKHRFCPTCQDNKNVIAGLKEIGISIAKEKAPESRIISVSLEWVNDVQEFAQKSKKIAIDTIMGTNKPEVDWDKMFGEENET